MTERSIVFLSLCSGMVLVALFSVIAAASSSHSSVNRQMLRIRLAILCRLQMCRFGFFSVFFIFVVRTKVVYAKMITNRKWVVLRDVIRRDEPSLFQFENQFFAFAFDNRRLFVSTHRR